MKHVVGFSGGIDSQACALWVRNRYPREDVILLNSDAGGNEHPLTVEFIADYSTKVHPVIHTNAQVQDMGGRNPGKIKELGLLPTDPLTFDLLAVVKGRFPSSKAQFCTEHLKTAPQLRWMRANLPDGEYTRYTGVRRDESRNRSDTPPCEDDDYFDCLRVNPIFDWTKQMCFDYVKAHGEPINPLYSLGFTRVGCAPCINSGKDDILRWAQRFPEMIDKVRAYEKRAGRTFFAPTVPGMTMNFVDDVVKWAHTVHGGKQISLHVLQPRPNCESKFGLCE